MQIQLISNTCFFEFFQLPTAQRFCGLVPHTIVCQEGKLISWFFNSQKDPSHPILRKNKDNLATLRFVKQLATSIDCYEKVKDCSSVAEVFTNLQAEFKKEQSQVKQYFNQTVMFLDQKSMVPKYIRILDFIKSLANRSFNEPQCPEGWRLFQEVTLSRMKQHELYFVEVFKPEGDMTFRFNYYKWISKNISQQQFSEISHHQIYDHKEIVKVYDQTYTQKLLVTVLQLISYLQTNFKLQIRRLVARYNFNKHQEAVLKGVSELKLVAPKKFIDYNMIESQQTLTIFEYLEIESNLRKMPEILISVVPKILKKQICPGSFCSAILKTKLNSLYTQTPQTPSHQISWSVIESNNNPEIIRNLIEIGLIELPNFNNESKTFDKEPNNKFKQQTVKVCNKCFLVYKAISKIDKAETDFQSKELKKLVQNHHDELLKKPPTSRSTNALKKNHIQYNINLTKDQPRSRQLTPQKLPLIALSERKYNPSSFQTSKSAKVPRKFTKSQTFEPIISRYQNNKIQSPLLQSIVGQKFRSKNELKQLLFKHFQRNKDSPQKQLIDQKVELINKPKPKHDKKSIVIPAKNIPYDFEQRQVADQLQNLIHKHMQSTDSSKKQKEERAESLFTQVYAILAPYDKVKASIDWFQADTRMELNYCLLSHVEKSSKLVLVIFHDMVSSYLEYLEIAAKLINQQLKILLVNYPGQAYTKFGAQRLTGMVFSSVLDRLLCHLTTQNLIDAENDRICFCGIGYGGYMLKYLNMNYRYYPNWNAVLLINSPSDIQQGYEKFILKQLEHKNDEDPEPFKKVKDFYKNYYKVTDQSILSKLVNEMSNQGLIYLMKSSLDESNQFIEIKASKLKVVTKQILLMQDDKSVVVKKRATKHSVIPVTYPTIYAGKESGNFSLITSNKFGEVLFKFIEKNF